MTRAQMLAALLLAACGEASAPMPLDVAALAGRTYRVSLQSDGPISCNALDVAVGSDTVTWQPACPDPPGFLERAAGGVRQATTQAIELFAWQAAPGAGNDSLAVEEFTFSAFTGSPSAPRSRWLGPCTISLGGPIGCRRESGTAIWTP